MASCVLRLGTQPAFGRSSTMKSYRTRAGVCKRGPACELTGAITPACTPMTHLRAVFVLRQQPARQRVLGFVLFRLFLRVVVQVQARVCVCDLPLFGQ